MLFAREGTRTAKIVSQIKDWDSTHSVEAKNVSRTNSTDKLITTESDHKNHLAQYYDSYNKEKEKVQTKRKIVTIGENHQNDESVLDVERGAADNPKITEKTCLQIIASILEDIFHIEERGSTIGNELFCGLVHFFACMYVIPVIPGQMAKAGYHIINFATACSAMSALGCFLAGFLTNLPIVVSPLAAVSVFVSVYLRSYNLSPHVGNLAVVYAGVCLTILGLLRPLTILFYKLIPTCIQIALGISIGFLVALAGAVELGLVVRGTYSILDMGQITHFNDQGQISIGFSAVLVIGICIMKKIRGINISTYLYVFISIFEYTYIHMCIGISVCICVYGYVCMCM